MAALIELLVVIDFGVMDSGSSSTATIGVSALNKTMESKEKHEEAGKIMRLLITRAFEMSYVTGKYWQEIVELIN